MTINRLFIILSIVIENLLYVKASLIIEALKKTTHRIKNHKVILHSDQGSQYSSYEYQVFLKHHNIIPSMSRRGNCYDNAVAESFFKTLKKELVRKTIFNTRAEARDKIFEISSRD